MNQIGVQRLNSQAVENPTCNTPEQVVAWLGALQGQDYNGVKWAIGARLPHSTEPQIEQAILDKRIVRTWLMRGTLCLVTFDDLGWMLDLIAPRILSMQARRYQQLELDHDTFKKSNDLIAHVLRDGATLSRREIFTRFEEQGISAKGQRGVHMLQKASLDGLIGQSVMIGNNPTFFLLETLQKRNFTREEALVTLAQRYFTSRGPATEQDFAWWTGLTLTDARAGLAQIKSQLVEDVINGETYWRDASTSSIQTSPPVVHLLPGFDEFYLGYKDRGGVIEAEFMQQVCPGNNGIFKPMIVIDGQIVGTWARTVKKKSVEVTLSPFTTLTDAESNAIRPLAKRYSTYLGLPLAD